jgi:tetratricopeptide (TPR) repeat protein
MQKFGRAIEDYSAALRISPKDSLSLYGRGLAEQALGQSTRANADIVAAKQIDPDIASKFHDYGF